VARSRLSYGHSRASHGLIVDMVLSGDSKPAGTKIKTDPRVLRLSCGEWKRRPIPDGNTTKCHT
jgi:hypothetical protein